MSQIMRAISLGVMAGAMLLAGCGEFRDSNEINSASGKHPDGWEMNHATAARADLEGCRSCHGDTFAGGISTVSCSRCHLGSGTNIHPDSWGDYGYARHKGYVSANGTASCANVYCHGATLDGVNGSGPSCATACHIGGVLNAHPSDWTSRSSHKAFVTSNGSMSCKIAACHGTDGKGVFLGGPACDQCHEMK
ncbi:MAG: hypothetical protein Fur0034_03070 [Desulfuromonadia bacterium]